MVCPLFGVPLPSIDIILDSSAGLSAKIEFSLRLTQAFMKDILASRAATAEVRALKDFKQSAILTRLYGNDDEPSSLGWTCDYVCYRVAEDSDSPYGTMLLDKDCAN